MYQKGVDTPRRIMHRSHTVQVGGTEEMNASVSQDPRAKMNIPDKK